MFFLLLLILPGVRSQDPTLPSYLPRSQQLSFNTVQFVQHKPAKKGPILFPNDAPPPPPTPLIVTSRPLSESIARSELNPNNSLAAQSQYHQVAYKPNYLARGKSYEPYSYTLATVAPAYDYDAYADTARITPTSKDSYEDQEPEKEPIRRNHILDNKKKGAEVRGLHTFSYSSGVRHTNKQASMNDYEIEFNDDDNNFDFDFVKLYARRNNFVTNTTKGKRFARVHNVNNFRYVQIKPTNPRANLRHKIKTHGTLRRPSNGVARSKNRVQMKGPRVCSMRSKACVKAIPKKTYNVVRRGGVMSPLKPADKKPFQKSDSRKNLQLRDAKPLYEFNNIQRQPNIAPKVDHYTYKNTPVQFSRSKINVDEHDYNKGNSHGDNYAFSYTVKDHKTGDDFSHSQKSTGSATNGEYRVRLPDGRMQIVSYTADENGYKADVRYDDHHEDDNSIDFDKDKDKEYLNNNLRASYNQNFGDTYLHRPQQNVQHVPSYSSNRPNNNNYKHFEDLHNYENDNDNFQYQPTLKPIPNTGFQFVYPTKSVYIDTTRANDRTTDSLTDINDDYLENYNSKQESNDKVERANHDYKFSDEIEDFPKDEMLDYSSELDQAYQPHKSKFSAFTTNQNAQASVRPPYNELKDLFVTNVNGRRNAAIAALPVVSTVRPVYAVTPANVVAITPKKPNLYTSIKNIASATPKPFLYSTPSPSTPRSYLLSTIANLKHQINLANKPVLSDHYINKINKYLSYTNPSKVDG